MIAVPHFSTVVAESALNGATVEIVSGLQYAANLAVRYQRPFGFKADITANAFNVFDADPKPDPVPPARPNNDPPVDINGVVQHPLNKDWYTRDFNSGSPYRGVRIMIAPFGGAVRFYPDGHSGAYDSTFAVSYGSMQKSITVSGATGRITVQ
jgi:Tfp pilus assembly protein FimT